MVDAAIIKGKIVMPTHVGSFRLASRSKEQLSVDIGEPLFIDLDKVDIRDDWWVGIKLHLWDQSKIFLFIPLRIRQEDCTGVF